MNSVKLTGNIGKDILVKEFEGGRMATFSLATNEQYVNREKEEVKSTTWHTIVAWGHLAGFCEENLQKGQFVSIEGKLNYRNYKNKDNQNVRAAEIVAFKIEEISREQESSKS